MNDNWEFSTTYQLYKRFGNADIDIYAISGIERLTEFDTSIVYTVKVHLNGSVIALQGTEMREFLQFWEDYTKQGDIQ